MSDFQFDITFLYKLAEFSSKIEALNKDPLGAKPRKSKINKQLQMVTNVEDQPDNPRSNRTSLQNRRPLGSGDLALHASCRFD